MGIQRKHLQSIVTLTVLTFQLVNPFMVHADGDGTPSPEVTPEVTITSGPTEETLVPEVTSTPVPTEPTADPVKTDTPIPPVDSTEIPTETPEPIVDPVETDTPIPPVDSTEIPTETPEPTVDSAEADTPIPPVESTETPTETPEPTVDSAEAGTPIPSADSEEVPPESPKQIESTPDVVESFPTEESHEEPNVVEILTEIPEGTDLVVLDENGGPEPLATQDAVYIIENGDPMWCPTGAPPIANTGGCTASTTSFNGANGLLPLIANKTEAGTIWITSNYNWTIADGSVVLDGEFLGTTADHALNIQGGWNGDDLGTISGTSHIFNFSILDWNNDITMNNVTQDVGKLIITTSGNATVNTTSNPSNGLGLIVTNVKFNNQSGTSLTLNQAQPVTVTFDYKIWNPNIYCPGCINQIVPGLDTTPAGYCAYNGVPGSSNNPVTGTDTHTYTSLAAGQTYYFSVYHDWQYTCGAALGNYSGKAPAIPTPTPLPPTFVTRAQGEAFDLSCIGQSGFAVNLPNGDLVNIFCPVSGRARIYRVDSTTLPVDLPIGYTYASAFALDIIQNDQPIPVILEGGYIRASFVAQPLQPGNSYSVLYWDGDNNTWIPLKEFLRDENGNTRSFDLFPGDDGDTRQIISGVRITDNGRVEVSTNFPGIFVLAQH